MQDRYFHMPIQESTINDSWKRMTLVDNGEPLIDISIRKNKKIEYLAEYYKKKMSGAVEICYVRETVADKLEEAAKLLPKNSKILIYDAWRPIAVQQRLFDDYLNTVSNSYDITENEAIHLAERYVSLPSTNENSPSPHFTGGSLDITITDENGAFLPMSMGDDNFNDLSITAYYEAKLKNEQELSWNEWQSCLSRRMLYGIMTDVGFTNFPNEWWHYDYGNQFWSYFTGQTAFYGISSPLNFDKATV